MGASDSSAGDVAKVVFAALENADLQPTWIEGEHDVIGAEDRNGAQVFVKVELA